MYPDNDRWYGRLALADLYTQIKGAKLGEVGDHRFVYERKHEAYEVNYESALAELGVDCVEYINRDEVGHFWRYSDGSWAVYKHGVGWVAETPK